ncbi:MAG: cytochrome c [Gammaproteobacteria bacterium]
MKKISFIFLFSLMTASNTVQAVDLKNGKIVHDKNCTSCHIAKYGKDGSGVYTKENRLVKNYSSLVQRVKACDINTNAGFHDDEVTNVIEYLNSSFYKFKNK